MTNTDTTTLVLFEKSLARISRLRRTRWGPGTDKRMGARIYPMENAVKVNYVFELRSSAEDEIWSGAGSVVPPTRSFRYSAQAKWSSPKGISNEPSAGSKSMGRPPSQSAITRENDLRLP